MPTFDEATVIGLLNHNGFITSEYRLSEFKHAAGDADSTVRDTVSGAFEDVSPAISVTVTPTDTNDIIVAMCSATLIPNSTPATQHTAGLRIVRVSSNKTLAPLGAAIAQVDLTGFATISPFVPVCIIGAETADFAEAHTVKLQMSDGAAAGVDTQISENVQLFAAVIKINSK